MWVGVPLMDDFFTNWIVFHHHYIFLIAGLLFLGCAFVLANRLIKWGMKTGSGYLLSFVLGSLFFLNLFFFILVIGNEEAQAIIFLPYLLQIIGVYGFLLITVKGFKSLYKRLINKKA